MLLVVQGGPITLDTMVAEGVFACTGWCKDDSDILRCNDDACSACADVPSVKCSPASADFPGAGVCDTQAAKQGRMQYKWSGASVT